MRHCENDVLEIKPRDKGFKFMVDMVEYPRAAIHVNKNAPDDVKLQLHIWLSKGWFSPVAYVRESDYVWEKLKE